MYQKDINRHVLMLIYRQNNSNIKNLSVTVHGPTVGRTNPNHRKASILIRIFKIKSFQKRIRILIKP